MSEPELRQAVNTVVSVQLKVAAPPRRRVIRFVMVVSDMTRAGHSVSLHVRDSGSQDPDLQVLSWNQTRILYRGDLLLQTHNSILESCLFVDRGVQQKSPIQMKGTKFLESLFL